MASDSGEPPVAEVLYEIFNIYATWSSDGRVGGMRFSSVRRLMRDLDIFEGIPADKVDAYVREHMLRADQDKDGMLSCQEFFVWFLTEIAANIPFKRNGASYHAGAPLYNRFVSYELIDSGTGARRKAAGLQLTAFLRLCADSGISMDAGLLRHSVAVARGQAAADRTLGKMESGTRLQFAQFVRALMHISAAKRVGLDSVLYRVVGDGRPPPLLAGGKACNRTYRMHVLQQLTSMFLESDMEAAMRWSSYDCDICGKSHSRWTISDPTIMQTYFRAIGVPYLPHFRHVNSRNCRAVFHRYNLRCNKGLMPHSSVTEEASGAEQEAEAGSGGAGPGAGDGDGDDDAAVAGGGSGSSSCPEDADLWSCQPGPCCCCYRSLGLMEMPTFWKLCMDNRVIREAIQDQKSPMTPQRVEAAFLAACSIGGVYCGDTSYGIHDRPLGPGVNLVAPRTGTLLTKGNLRSTTYGTPFDGASTMAASHQRPMSAPRGSSAAFAGGGTFRPASASVAPSASGSPWRASTTSLSPSLPASPGAGAGSSAHRAAHPTLSYPQFLEAVRLLAEDLVGHPQVLVTVEVALWRILHDMVAVGCPLPPGSNYQWSTSSMARGGRQDRRA